MKHLLHRLLSCCRGNSAVEFALAAPIITITLLGMSGLGLSINERMRLTNAARAGAQYAIKHPTDSAGTATAAKSASAGMGTVNVTLAESCGCADGTTVTCGSVCISGTTRTYVTVTVSETYPLLVTVPGIGSSAALTASASLRIQ